MADNSTVRAPYNFVPFSPKRPLLRYDSIDELPKHDVIDPALKTGEIHISLEAETPVFISDGNKENPHFFRDINQNFAIPGSSIRGMVRENMTILGFGLIRPGEDFEDRSVFYRSVASSRESIGGELKKYYSEVLAVHTFSTAQRKSYSIPTNVKAGYLHRENNEYYIQPVKDSYLRVSREHPDIKAIGRINARAVPVAYTCKGEKVTSVSEARTPGTNRNKGMLLYTGKSIKNPNHIYLFPEEDPDAIPVAVSNEDRLSYAADWEDRKNSLKGSGYDPNFWKLPDEGENKPVFYINYQGHVYFGMSLFLRIAYKFALSSGLPESHRNILKQDSCALDYVYAMLGFSQQEYSYKSRVSFENCVLKGVAHEKPAFKAVLGQPKPSYYPGYVKDGHNYNDEGFQLRGIKQYWLKSPEKPTVIKENAAAAFHPLAEGSVFTGTIHYKNLTEDELGLLLWSLRLDEGCFQSIGMGKPLGYGRMKLKIDNLKEFNFSRMYSPEGLCEGPEPYGAERVSHYIDIYDAYASKRLYVKNPKKKPSLRSLPELKDFFFIRSTIMDNSKVSYMALNEYGNKIQRPLPTIEDFRNSEDEKVKEKETSPAHKDMDTMLSELQKRFGHC